MCEVSDQPLVGSEECDEESVNSSGSATSDDDGDDTDSDSDSRDSDSSSDSSVTDDSAGLTDDDESCYVGKSSRSDAGTTHPAPTVTDSASVIENAAAAAAAAVADETADVVCKQLSSLTVSDEQKQLARVVSDLPHSDNDLPVEH